MAVGSILKAGWKKLKKTIMKDDTNLFVEVYPDSKPCELPKIQRPKLPVPRPPPLPPRIPDIRKPQPPPRPPRSDEPIYLQIY